MRTIGRLPGLLASLGALMFSAQSLSAGAILGVEKQSDPSAITILFVNGIRNYKVETAASSDKLIQSLKANGLPQATYNFDYFYNPTDGLLGVGDAFEVSMQQWISNAHWTVSGGVQSEYYRLLGNDYNARLARLNTLAGTEYRIVSVAGSLKQKIKDILARSSGVIIVPHSQGNLYAEAAYAMLIAEGNAAVVSRIRVVGVADAAVTTPSERYITHQNDIVITQTEPALASAQGLTFRPRAYNVTACLQTLLGGPVCDGNIGGGGWLSVGDPNAHDFVNVYLNPKLTSQADGRQFPKIIYDYVAASLSELPQFSQMGAVRYLTFSPLGDPGIAGDGLIITVPAGVVPQFYVSSPVSLNGLTNGFTLTAFPPPGQTIAQVTFGLATASGLHGNCNIQSGLFPSQVTVNGTVGYSVFFSQSYLETMASFLNGTSNCAGQAVAVGDLYFFMMQMWADQAGTPVTALDAAAVGAGPGAIPTTSTPPPPPDITPF